MAPLAEAVIAKGAKYIGESQSDFIERCVLDGAMNLIRNSKLLKSLAAREKIDPDLIKLMHRARKDALRRWMAELPEVGQLDGPKA